MIAIDYIVWWEEMEILEIFAYRTVMHFTDQTWMSKTVYYIRCVMVCKIGLINWNAKIAFLRASMVVTYYIKLFRMGPDRCNGVLMTLLLLVAETEYINHCNRDFRLLCLKWNETRWKLSERSIYFGWLRNLNKKG